MIPSNLLITMPPELLVVPVFITFVIAGYAAVQLPRIFSRKIEEGIRNQN